MIKTGELVPKLLLEGVKLHMSVTPPHTCAHAHTHTAIMIVQESLSSRNNESKLENAQPI